MAKTLEDLAKALYPDAPTNTASTTAVNVGGNVPRIPTYPLNNGAAAAASVPDAFDADPDKVDDLRTDAYLSNRLGVDGKPAIPSQYSAAVDMYLNQVNQLAANNRNFKGTNLLNGGKYPNLNGRNAKDTVRMQRLVDKLNNKVYLTPGSVGLSVFGRGLSVDRAPVRSTTYQMPAVETVDTRQMKALREWEDAIRKAEITRQQGYEDFELTAREGWMKKLQQDARNLTDADLLMLNNEFNHRIHLQQLQVSQAYAKDFAAFTAYVNNNIKRENAQIALDAYAQSPMMGDIIARFLTGIEGLPDAQQRALMQFIEKTYADAIRAGKSPIEVLSAMTGANAQAAVAGITGAANALTPDALKALDKLKESANTLLQ